MDHEIMDSEITELAAKVLAHARAKGAMIATVESCTGGLIIGALTDIPGSSDVVDRGFVTYSNEAKTKMVGVPADLIEAHGAVSREVAIAMAQGGLANSNADIAVSVTGVAGPGGGTANKPVGLVHFAVALNLGKFEHDHKTDTTMQHQEHRFGDIGRSLVRRNSVIAGLRHLTKAIENQ